ncbi:MAG: DUF86 domain-containing protein [Candidatus Parvarchaeum sp.]
MDNERILYRLKELEYYMSLLEKILPSNSNEYKKLDEIKKAAIERYCQLISEAQLDICKEIYKSMNLPPPNSNESIFQRLEGKIDSKTLSKIIKLREVRNELVHAYSSFDDLRLFNALIPNDYMYEFIKEIKRLIQ